MITEWRIVSGEVGRQSWRGRTIKSEWCPDVLSLPPSKPSDCCGHHPTPPASAPCLEFKQLCCCCFVEMASGCLFSFLAFYFLPFFFPEASQVASAKRDGRWLEVTDTRRHGGRQQQHPAPRLAGRGGAVLWIKRFVLWRGLYGRKGRRGRAFSNLHMNKEKKQQLLAWL